MSHRRFADRFAHIFQVTWDPIFKPLSVQIQVPFKSTRPGNSQYINELQGGKSHKVIF